MKITRRAIAAAVACAAAIGSIGFASAQDYPTRVVKLVVPYPPGGPTDAVGRLLASKLGQQLQQQVIVENRPGAGGNLGTDAVAKSTPDGYTLVMSTNGPLAGNLALVKDMPYDPLKDLAPVTLAFHAPSLLAVHPSVPAKTAAELIDLLKAHPEKYSFASAGLGTSSHFAGELFKSTVGAEMVHVPYKGDGPSLAAVLSSQPQIFFGSIATALPHAQAGKLRILAVTSAKRVPLLADVPTLEEAGLTGFDLGGWYAIMAPAGTPAPIVAKLNQAFNSVLADPDVVSRIKAMGGIPVGGSSEVVTDLIRRDIPKWAAIAKASGANRQ